MSLESFAQVDVNLEGSLILYLFNKIILVGSHVELMSSPTKVLNQLCNSRPVFSLVEQTLNLTDSSWLPS